jgi:hypothetical protein
MCKHDFSWSWAVLGEAGEAVGPPWALVSRQRCQEIWGGGVADGYKKSVRDWSIGAPALRSLDSFLRRGARGAHKATGLTSSSTLWHAERMKDLPKGLKQQEGRIWKKGEKAGWVQLQDLWIKIEGGREMPSNLKSVSKIAINNHILEDKSKNSKLLRPLFRCDVFFFFFQSSE